MGKFSHTTTSILRVIFTLSYCATAILADSYQYGILFDAGSTGTRLTINRWPLRQFSDNSQLPPPFAVPIETDFKPRVTPGINLPEGRDALVGMLAATQVQLANESSRWSTFPVFLCATAGMRILNESARSSA